MLYTHERVSQLLNDLKTSRIDDIEQKYEDIKQECPHLWKMIVNNSDLSMLNQMLHEAKQIKYNQNELEYNNASQKIGNIVHNKYFK